MADFYLKPASGATSCASSSTVPDSTSHGSTNKHVYDVFINHHERDDMEKGLASAIYLGLIRRGLRVFLDIAEIQSGEKLISQIKEAIRTASVCIAIFSRSYAESTYCLDVLVQMVESKKTIFPVLYGVNRSDLRWTRSRDNGVYARALGMLEKKSILDFQPRYDSNTIQKWRNVLSSVGDVSSFEMDRYEGDKELLVCKVVERVLLKVQTPLHVARYPTSLDEKVKEFEREMLSQQENGNSARVLGIVGLGGVGKTTLAKEFFNRHRSNYEGSCFLFDVREKAATSSLNSLQAELLKELIHLNEKINSDEEGVEKLKRHLSSSHRVLIVLDDVDQSSQVEALILPVKDTIHSSSLILVTSRDKHLLRWAGIEDSSIFVLHGLNIQQSGELFCLHAFNQPYPVTGFKQLVKKISYACNGLPLTLKVLGSLLCGERDLIHWEAQLHLISQILPNDIHSLLEVSYHNLDEKDQQIFLDIACFFTGEDRDTAIRIWDGSGWKGWLGLQTLENRCLVEVDSENRIRMHDQVRDLGRNLAEKQHPRLQLRLWRTTDDHDLLNVLSGKSPVRGINVCHGNGRGKSSQSLAKLARGSLSTNLRSLQLLRAKDKVESTIMAALSPQLVWLHWYSCPFSALPSRISLKNLRVLHIEGSILKRLWQRKSQVPLELRELNIYSEHLRIIPESIGELKHLEKLVLGECSNLHTLPDSIGNMANLQSLDLRGCSALQMLPNSFINLENLRHLDLSKCSNLEMLPYSLGILENLSHVNLSECSNLQMLPTFLNNLKNLRHIDLSYCSNLQTLPNSFGDLRNLQHINLTGCLNLQMLPNSFGNLTNLQHIDLSGCSKLPILPNSFGHLMQLKYLFLRKCHHLTISSETLGQIRTLECLEIPDCYGIELLEIGTLVSLKELRASKCINLKSIQGLAQLAKLRKLDVANCSVLKDLQGVEHLKSLEFLDHSGCPKLQLGGVWGGKSR